MSDLKLKGKWKFSKIYKAVWEAPISTKAKITFGALEWFGDKIFPSHKTLADMTGLSVPGIKRAIKELQENGFLSWEKRKGSTSEYELFPEGNQAHLDLGHHELTHHEPRDRSNEGGDLDHDDPLTKQVTTPKNKTITPQGEFVDWFKDQYKAKFGKPYVDSKADYIQAAQIVKLFTLDTLKVLVPVAWDNKDPFIKKMGMTVKGFVSVVNQLSVPKKPQAPISAGGPQDVGWLQRTRAERAQQQKASGE